MNTSLRTENLKKKQVRLQLLPYKNASIPF